MHQVQGLRPTQSLFVRAPHLRGHVGGQHLRQLVILEATLQELLFRQTSIIVLVHPVEDILGSLLGRVRRLHSPGAQHVVDRLNNLGHLLLVDNTVAVHVVHSESPFELLFRRARRGDVDGEQELFEIYEPIFVRVEGAEDVVAELLRVATREEQLVHVNELGRGEPAIGAVLLEPLVPLLDCVLVVARVRLEELKVLLTQALLALNAAHAACP